VTVEELGKEGFHLDNPESKGVFVLCHREQRPYLINDVQQIREGLSERSRRFLQKIGSKSFLCCPILYENECLGVLAVDNVQSKRPLLESDLNLLMGIAPEIGISLHNALLTEEREEQFHSVIRTLAASIDTRDNLTAGHSARVTDFAVEICQEMGVGEEFTEVVRVAAQLHDYGKIGIKDSILKKEGTLSDDERREIETHAAKSEEILSQIKFYGAYQQVPFIAGSHHERLDGKGYPRGLTGKEIPLGARIIAVADFFEAITAKRHYREPMSFEQAVELLKRESGPHLEPEIVETFLKILGRA
jgi:HD-GYP domain-containing protein (c-di-GMP phosphodiesterase class II)